MRIAYMSIAAAEGNLGDIHIRREAISLVASHVDTGVVYTGAMSSSYVDSFRLPVGWLSVASPHEFLRLLVRDGLKGGAVVIMAPGPAPLSGGILSSAKRVAVALFFSLLVIGGNQLLVLGRALRGKRGLALRAEKLMESVASLYMTRDKVSVDLLGGRGIHAPDLAFLNHVSAPNVKRSIVGVSLRHDRSVSFEAIEGLVREIRSKSLEPIFVTQVREDGVKNRDLARRFGSKFLPWEDGVCHSEQEALVSNLYDECSAVISDRLHVLLLGARRGAIPVIVDSPAESKLHATLDGYLSPQSVELWCPDGNLSIDVSESERDRIDAGMRMASAQLADIQSKISQILAV